MAKERRKRKIESRKKKRKIFQLITVGTVTRETIDLHIQRKKNMLQAYYH
jgi:hypothetical protein